MKKIIVLGMLFLSYAVPIVSSEENPVFAALIIGITFLGLKVATDRLEPISSSRSTFCSNQSSNLINSQEINPNNSGYGKINPILSEKKFLTGSVIASSKKGVRGLLDAKRDELHVPDMDCATKVVDIDAMSSSSVQGLVTNKIPFPVSKVDVKTNTSLQSATMSLGLQSVSPHDYHNIHQDALSPQKGFAHDHEEDGFIVIAKK